MRVEECWRTMKSGLRTRPVFHWRPHRICAHISLCVLALLLERVAEQRGGDTWRNILAQLDTIKVVEYERGTARVRQTTELRPDTLDLLRRLGFPRRPSSTRSIQPPPPSNTRISTGSWNFPEDVCLGAPRPLLPSSNSGRTYADEAPGHGPVASRNMDISG